MKNMTWLITTMLTSLMTVGVASATFQEVIIWDPNGNLGTFTDPTSNFDDVLSHLSASADVSVTGSGDDLKTAVTAASSGTAANPVVIEITDSATYNGGIIITDKTNIVIRAKAGETPVIDCSVLGRGVTCLLLDSTADRNVKNIGIKGLTFKDIRRRGFGGDAPPPNATRPASGGGIASFNGKILENIVIEDNVFDNFDATKDETFKGEAIHLNEVDGLLIRRNTIRNGGAHGFASADENGAITVHEFDTLPVGGGGTQNDFLNNVFIQNNEILFDYAEISTVVTSQTRGIVLGHVGRTLERFNNVVVEYNLIDNAQKEGIKVFGTSTDGSDDETTHVSNNVIKRTANGIEIDAGVVFIDSTIFDDQTISGAESKNEAINADGGTTTVTNTIVIEKTKGVTGGAAKVTVTCIDLFNASLTHPTNDAGGTEFNVDPMFVNTAINDYTIGNGSFPAGCAGGEFGLELISVGVAEALVCELKVKELKGTSQRVADSMHFETFNIDPNLLDIWETLFDSIPGMPLNDMVTLQADQVVTWEEGTLKMGGVMKVDVKTEKADPTMKKVTIKKAEKKDGTTTFVSGVGGVNPNLADGGWHEVNIMNMANVTVAFGPDTVTGFLKGLQVKLDKSSTTAAPVVGDFKIDITGVTLAADVKKGTVASVEVTIPETTVTAKAGTEYEEKIKDNPEVLGGHTEAEFKRAKDAGTEGVDIASLIDTFNDQLKERKGSCAVGP